MSRRTHPGTHFVIIGIIGAFLLVRPGAPSWGASVVSLGELEGGDFTEYGITDASGDMSVLVGWASDGERRPFRWTRSGGMQGLGSLPGRNASGTASAVSTDGSTVVGWNGAYSAAFRWTESGGMQELVTGLSPGQESFANAVSADGNVVVGHFQSNQGWEAFQWRAGSGWSRLLESPASYVITQALGVSEDGSVVLGIWNDGWEKRLLRWTEETGFQTFADETPVGYLTFGDMTPDASTVVGTRSVGNDFFAYLWSAASGFEDLFPPPSGHEHSLAYAVSDDGSTVIGNHMDGSLPTGFVWNRGDGARIFEPEATPGRYLPWRISGDGRTVTGVIRFPDASEVLLGGPWIWDVAHGVRLLEDELTKHYGLDLEGRRLEFASEISFDGSTIFGTGTNAAGEADLWIARLDGCRDTQEEPNLAGAPPGPHDAALNVILDSTAANAGGGEGGTLSRLWEIVSGPGAIIGPADGPLAEIQSTGLGSAVVRLTVNDGACDNPAFSDASIHFCDVRRAPNAMFVGRCDVAADDAPRLSADGKVIIDRRRSETRDGNEATRWTLEEGEAGLGDLPHGEFESRATDLSFDGSVIVGRGHAFGQGQVFRWSAETGMVGIWEESNLHPVLGRGVALSADGSRLAWNPGGGPVYWTEETGIQPFAKFVLFHDFFVKGASADGSALLVQDEPLAYRLRQDSELEPVGDLPGGEGFSVGNDLSADGSTIVGRAGSTRGTEALRWTAELGSSGLGDLPGGEFSSEAHGVTADGSVVVGRGSGPDGLEAFIWDEERGMRRLKQVLEADFGLDLTGWKIEAGLAVSDDGLTILGSGVDPEGNSQTWLARLDLCGDPPEMARIDGVPVRPVSTVDDVILDGSRSSPAPGEESSIIGYLWEVVAGDAVISGAADQPLVTVRSAVPGAVRIRLSVDDGGCGGRPGTMEVEIAFRAPSPGMWVRCNANGGSTVDIADAVHTLNHLFGGGPASECIESTDCNSDGSRDLSDAVYLLSFLFTGGEPPAAPYPDCDIFPACEDTCR